MSYYRTSHIGGLTPHQREILETVFSSDATIMLTGKAVWFSDVDHALDALDAALWHTTGTERRYIQTLMRKLCRGELSRSGR